MQKLTTIYTLITELLNLMLTNISFYQSSAYILLLLLLSEMLFSNCCPFYYQANYHAVIQEKSLDTKCICLINHYNKKEPV